MAEITLRVPLGRPLTYQEVDDNFRSVQELTLLAQQFAQDAQGASVIAVEAKDEAVAAKDEAWVASGSAASDAQRAEDAADRAEAIADFDGLHNTLAGRNEPGAHDASAIGYGDSSVEDALDNAIIRVDSVESIRLLPAPKRNTIVYVECYYSPGDGGGGSFRWDPSSILEDDGVMVFGSYRVGRWLRDLEGQRITLRQGGLLPTGNDNNLLLSNVFSSAVSYGLEVVVDGLYELTDEVLLTNEHSGIRIVPASVDCGFTWKAGLNFLVSQEKTILRIRPSGLMKNVYIGSLVLDGNKNNVTSDHDNSVSGIHVLVQGEGSFENVVIDGPICRNNRGTGIRSATGGIRIKSPICYGNTWHGIGISSYPAFLDILYIHEPHCYDNGGYGIDFSKGRTVVTGEMRCERNMQGGSKVADNCEYVKIDTMRLIDNYAFGFRSTGSAPNLVLDIGRLIVRGQQHLDTATYPGRSFNMSTGKRISIGQMDIAQGNCIEGADVYFSAVGADIKLGDVVVVDSNIEGITIFGGVKVKASSITLKECPGLGMLIGNGSRLDVGDLSFINTNKNKITGSLSTSSTLRIQASNLNVKGKLSFVDNQAEPTQIRGMYAYMASKVVIKDAEIEGITADSAFGSAGAGTSIDITGDTTGFTNEYIGVATANGGGMAVLAYYDTPLDSIAASVYEIYVIPKSTDAIGLFAVTGVSQARLDLSYPNPTPVGTGNLAYNVSVKRRIRR